LRARDALLAQMAFLTCSLIGRNTSAFLTDRALARNGIERSDCSQQQRYAQADFGAATGRIAAAVVADEKARTAELAAERAAPKDKPAVEIKALRARERAAELASSVGDRIALARALKVKPASVPPAPSEPKGQAPSASETRRTRGRLTEAQIKAAVDRAVERSRRTE